MLADLFYFSAIWLLLSLAGLLRWGRSSNRKDYPYSIWYLGTAVVAGDILAMGWLGEPFELVAVASLVVMAFAIFVVRALRDWNAPAQTFFTFSLSTSLIYLIYAFTLTAFTTTSVVAFLLAFFLWLLEVGVLMISLSYVFEVLDVLCRVSWRRVARPADKQAQLPKISLHVPAYNEPPEIVEKTLRSLAALDYPSYEVILVDNNTPKESAWKPLAVICKELGFKCLHLERWPGYKSGALNFALAMTDAEAEIIGVVDSDYEVRPDFLRRVVPYFQDPQVAFVQTPQDYRNFEGNRFFQAVYDGYRYFFALSMPARNERNAIIFCGTMGLLRKRVLQEVGGWDEWCITEDAEASLRILDRGYKSLYVNETFGRGLMPLNLEGLKKQRFRWAFGGIQILKKHWGKLMPWSRWIDPSSRLTGAQRYFYLASGLQWFNELLTFAFTLMVLISAALTITGNIGLLRPTVEAFVVLPVVLIGTNLIRALWGLRHALGLTWKRAFLALTLWFSLTWSVTLACLQAVIRKGGVFLRTPKALAEIPWIRAIQASTWETLVGVTCLVAGLSAFARGPSLFTFGLLLLCLSQSAIYLSAPFHSYLSLENAGRIAMHQPDRADIAGSIASELRLGVQVALVSITLVAFAFTASLVPGSGETPWWYQYFNPESLVVPRSDPTRNGPPHKDRPPKKDHPDQGPRGPKKFESYDRVLAGAAWETRTVADGEMTGVHEPRHQAGSKTGI